MKKLNRRSDTLNPIEGIHKDSPHAADDCRDLSKLIELREEKMDGNSAHFVERATARIKAVIAANVVFGESPNRSLQDVREVLANPEKLKVAMECMTQSQAWDGMLARMGYDLATPQGDEGASIASTAHRFLDWLDSPAMAAQTRSSSFDPAELRNGRMTVYIVLPPNRKEALKGWLRMVVGTLMTAVMKGGIQR